MSDFALPTLRLRLATRIPSAFSRQIDLPVVRRVIERALINDDIHGDVEVSLVITTDEKIRRLNVRHRGVDSATDVLSFPLLSEEELRGEANFVFPPDHVLRLGDIVLSFPRAVEQAQQYDHSIARELAYLTVHGTLHLLGYDHEDEAEQRVMRAKEEAALRSEPGLQRAGD